jgi:hypothetical protein
VAQSSARPLPWMALALVLAAAAACGSSAGTTSAVPAIPTATPLAMPSVTLSLVPSPLTSGYATAEEAIRAWLEIQGLDYSGDCETGTRDEGTYCSSLYQTVGAGRIYVSGPVNSEAAYWILVPQIGGLWYVADAATFSLTSAPPTGWH